MKAFYGIAAVTAILAAASIPGGIAKASSPNTVESKVGVFDARADGSASSYCLDAPAVLVGQQICGGFLRSTVTATSDPRGFALGGIAPVPKLSSVPLLIPNNFQGVPVPEQVQAGLKQIKFDNIPSQCQASFPALNPGDDDQTCGGPTYGNSALGFIGSDANAHVFSTGDETNPTSTRTTADSRIDYADLTGLQSTFDNVRSLSQSGLNSQGNPMSVARMTAGSVSFLSGAFKINNIVSDTSVVFNGNKADTAASTVFKYTSASFAGVPVDITPAGLVLATNTIPAEQTKTFQEQLNTALANNNGFGAKLLPAPPIQANDSIAKASSGGIEVSYRGSTGTDVVYDQILGATSAQVSAVPVAAGAASVSSSSSITPSTGAVGVSDSPIGASPMLDPDTARPAGSIGDVPNVDADGTSNSPATGAMAGAGTIAAAETNQSMSSEAGSGPVTHTFRQVGDQALLTGFSSTQSISSSRLKDVYPIFGALLLATFVVAGLRRRPFGERSK